MPFDVAGQLRLVVAALAAEAELQLEVASRMAEKETRRRINTLAHERPSKSGIKANQ